MDTPTIGDVLNHPMMANISEKDISILAGNLNSGLSYLITTVTQVYKAKPDLYGLGKSRSKKSRSLFSHISTSLKFFNTQNHEKEFCIFVGFFTNICSFCSK